MDLITLISINIYKQIVLRKPNGLPFNKPWVALCKIKIDNTIHMFNFEGDTKEELEGIAEERCKQWMRKKQILNY